MALRNRKLIGWKIWYGDGTVLTSEYNIWQECKQDNVQIIKLFYESDMGIETNIHQGREYYILDDLLKLPPEIKTAKAINGEDFYDMREKAEKDKKIVTVMKT